MSLILKGLLWKDRVWTAEIRGLGVDARGGTAAEACEALAEKLKELAPDLEYHLDSMDGIIYFESDNLVRVALLILERKGRP